MVSATSKASDQPVHMCSLIRAFASRLNILWMSSYWLNEFLSFKGSYTGSSESTLVKIPHCWKSHVTAHLLELTNSWRWTDFVTFWIITTLVIKAAPIVILAPIVIRIRTIHTHHHRRTHSWLFICKIRIKMPFKAICRIKMSKQIKPCPATFFCPENILGLL